MIHGRTQIGIWKSISVRKLRELLATLDDNDLLECNDLGNILIFSGAQEDIENVQRLGYIDIATEDILPSRRSCDER
jgi:hypothetical protein